MTALATLDRTLADANDRETWLAVHDDVIGSYRAGQFARADSAETYIRQILTPKGFRGNAATKSGIRWEPMLLAWAGAEPNSLLIHHPDERQFGATVDGTIVDSDTLVIVETKAKHNQIVTWPKPTEIRQMAWQLYCIPEASEVRYVWGELVRDTAPDSWRLRRDPQTLVFDRQNPVIAEAIDLIVPIARQVLAGLRAARRIREVVF